MDRISDLPDETISKILSFLRTTKDVMPTMLLSKRWKSLWMFVPILQFYEFGFWDTQKPDFGKFSRFVDRSLMSRIGQVLQSLHLLLGKRLPHGDIEIWVRTAAKLGIKELVLKYIFMSSCGLVPKCLYTCETLVALTLENGYLDVPDLVCLRSLKTLTLKSMTYSNPNALLILLPKCLVLEDLFLEERYDLVSRPPSFKIVLPSLKRLSLITTSTSSGRREVAIDAPSLKYLRILDYSGSFSFSEKTNINQVLTANIDVILKRPVKLLHSLASAARIRLCLSASEVVYPDGSCFHMLKYLEVCPCKSMWLSLFLLLLKDSPSLKVIRINQCHPVTNPRPRHRWNQPASVPSCLSSKLETFEWINYEGTQYEKELSTYILKTAVYLKKASFTARSNDHKEKLQMLQELSLSRRVSSTCELVFN